MTGSGGTAKSVATSAAATGAASASGAGSSAACPYANPGVHIDHVFDGELKPKKASNPTGAKKASGMHSANAPDGSKAKRTAPPAETDAPPPDKIIVPIAGGEIDDKGCYGAEVYIHDPDKNNGAGGWRKKRSSMYPDGWSKAKVEAEIQEAYRSAAAAGALEDAGDDRKRFTATNPSGVTIQGIYNEETGEIETGFPAPPPPPPPAAAAPATPPAGPAPGGTP